MSKKPNRNRTQELQQTIKQMAFAGNQKLSDIDSQIADYFAEKKQAKLNLLKRLKNISAVSGVSLSQIALEIGVEPEPLDAAIAGEADWDRLPGDFFDLIQKFLKQFEAEPKQ